VGLSVTSDQPRLSFRTHLNECIQGRTLFDVLEVHLPAAEVLPLPAVPTAALKLPGPGHHLLLRSPAQGYLVLLVPGQIGNAVLLEQLLVVAQGQALLPAEGIGVRLFIIPQEAVVLPYHIDVPLVAARFSLRRGVEHVVVEDIVVSLLCGQIVQIHGE